MKYGYLIYLAFAFFGVVLVIVPFLLMRRARRVRGYHAKGFLLMGPMHFVLAKREYTLTSREIVLAILVILLVLIAPLLTYLLER